MTNKPVPVILETDMETDIDDAAALTMLHALADNGECRILAVMHNTSDDYGPGVISVLNTWRGRPDVPIGVYKPNDAPSAFMLQKGSYTKTIATSPLFPKSVVTRADCPDAVDLYRDVLRRESDHSVVIVSIGWTTNLARLLRAEDGIDLVKRKVRRLIVMGGQWIPTDEHHLVYMNLAGNHRVRAAYEAGKFVLDNWPTEMIFSGFTVGRAVLTGNGLKALPKDNPLREIYRIYKEDQGLADWSHPSWDQTAVWFAVRGEGGLFQRCGGGTPCMDLLPDPEKRCLHWRTIWRTDRPSPHSYLRLAAPPEKAAAAIEALMIQPPKS